LSRGPGQIRESSSGESLAEPCEGDDLLRRAVRRQLAERTAPRPRRRRPARIALGTAAVAAATAAVAVLADVGTTGSGGPAVADAAVIHHALEAVTGPANTIIHEKIVGVQNGTPVEAEWWQETSPPYASRVIKGPVGHELEASDNGTTSFDYEPGANAITEQPDSSPSTPIDPVSAVRQELASGQAHLAGTVVLGGSSLYKITLPNRLVGYFDTGDYRPRYLDDPQRDGTVVRVRVVVYEYLPMTASNRALLSVTAQHPAARLLAAQPASGADATRSRRAVGSATRAK
jgi:hypothetical protein